MHGDIKGAFLSDTDTTNLAPNDILGGKGTFDDASNWIWSATWSITLGHQLHLHCYWRWIYQKVEYFTTGARYVITDWTVCSSYSVGTLYVYCGTGAPGTAITI